jgi:uncharacterized spore protein YtfJ
MAITKSKSEGTEAALREAESVTVGFARVVEQLAKHVGAHSHASSVFGEPVTREGVTVIPVARVFGAFGAGAGSGSGTNQATGEDHQGVGGGVGGGGGYVVTPVGMIEIRPEGARFIRMQSQAGVWGDVADLLLFVARRGWSSLAHVLKKD